MVAWPEDGPGDGQQQPEVESILETCCNESQNNFSLVAGGAGGHGAVAGGHGDQWRPQIFRKDTQPSAGCSELERWHPVEVGGDILERAG